jgi:hypothetical protein
VYALGRDIGQAWFFSGKGIIWLGPLIAPLEWVRTRYLGNGWASAGIYGPGLLLLAAAGAWRGAPAPGGRRLGVPYLAMALVLALLSLGPLLQMREMFGPALPGPHVLLARVLPGFDALRVPMRAATVAMLGLCVLAGLGAEALLGRAHGRGRRALQALVVAIVVAEAWRPGLWPAPLSWQGRPPAPEAWIASQPGPGAVLELPAGAPLADGRAMVLSAWHWRPVVNGSSGFNPTVAWLRTAFATFPDDDTVRLLHDLGVRFVVVRGELGVPSTAVAACRAIPPAMAPWLRLGERSGAGCVLEVVGAPPAPPRAPERPVSLAGARVTSAAGDDASAAHDGDLATHWMHEIDPRAEDWLQVDLPAPHPLTRLTLRLGPHFGEFMRQVRIETSADGRTWTPLVDLPTVAPPLRDVRRHPGDLAVDVDLPGVPVQHLRIVRPANGPATPPDQWANWRRWGVHELVVWERAA